MFDRIAKIYDRSYDKSYDMRSWTYPQMFCQLDSISGRARLPMIFWSWENALQDILSVVEMFVKLVLMEKY